MATASYDDYCKEWDLKAGEYNSAQYYQLAFASGGISEEEAIAGYMRITGLQRYIVREALGLPCE